MFLPASPKVSPRGAANAPIDQQGSVLNSTQVRRARAGNSRVRVSNKIWPRICADSVRYPGIVAGDRAAITRVGDAVGCPALNGSDTRELPASEKGVRPSCRLEERQIIDIAERKHVPLVEVRTGAIGGEIVRVEEASVPRRRSVVDGMGISVSGAKLQCSYCLSPR